MADVATAIQINIDPRGSVTGARRVNQTLDGIRKKGTVANQQLGKSFQKSSSTAIGAFDRIKRAAFALTAVLGAVGLGFGIINSISLLRDFEFEMSRVSAITGALRVDLDNVAASAQKLGFETVDAAIAANFEFEALEATARSLGATTVFTASSAAQGMRLLSQAGFEANEVLAAIPATLNLAVAGALDLATAADLTSAAVRGFNLDASEAGRVADIFAATAASANTTVLELGNAIKFVAPVAQSLGITLEETAAAIGVLSDAGLKASLAGTALRRVLSGLVNLTPKAEAIFEDLGVTLGDIDPQFNSLVQIAEEFQRVNLGAADAFGIFQQRGGAAAIILATMSERFKELAETTEGAQGAALRMADIMKDNLRGDLLEAKSAMEELILATGDRGLRGSMRATVQNVIGFTRALNGTLDPLDEANKGFFVAAERASLFGQAIAFLIGGAVLGKLLVVLAPLASGMFALATGATTASQAIAVLNKTFLANPVIFLAVAIGGLSFALFKLARRGSAAQNEIDGLRNSMAAALRITKALEAASSETLIAAIPQIKATREALEQDINVAEAKIKEFVTEIARLEQGDRNLFEGSLDSFIESVTFLQGGQVIGPAEAKVKRLQAAIFSLEQQGARAGVQMVNLGNDLRRALAAEKETATFNAEVQSLVASLEDFEDAGSAAQAATQAIKDAIEDTRFEISQLQLGRGATADVTRAVNEALREQDLDVVITTELKERGESITRRLLQAKERLEVETDITKQARIQGQIKALTFSDAALKAEISLRKEQRKELVAATTALVTLEQQNDATEKSQKKLDKEIARGAAITKAALTPLQEYTSTQEELADLLTKGIITQLTYDQALQNAAESLATATMKTEELSVAQEELNRRAGLEIATQGVFLYVDALGTAEDATKEFGKTIAENLGTAVKDSLLEGENAVDAFINALRRIGDVALENVIEGQIIKPLTAGLGKVFEGPAGGGNLLEGLFGGKAPLADLFGVTGDLAPATTPPKGTASDPISVVQVSGAQAALSNPVEAIRKLTEDTNALGEKAIEQGVTNAADQVAATNTVTQSLGDRITGALSSLGSFLSSSLSSLGGTLQSGLSGLGNIFTSGLSGLGGLLSSGGGAIAGAAGSAFGGIASVVGSAFGGIGGAIGSVLGALFHDGGLTSAPSAMTVIPHASLLRAPSYQGGRRGGAAALLHPEEAVVPLRDGGIPVNMEGGGGRTVNVTNVMNITTPDAKSFQDSQSQIAERQGRLINRAVDRNS